MTSIGTTATDCNDLTYTNSLPESSAAEAPPASAASSFSALTRRSLSMAGPDYTDDGLITAVTLDDALDELPLIAILRGITPEEVVPVGKVLVDAGFRVLVVPLTSPDPFHSLRLLVEAFDDTVMIGAGMVLHERQVGDVARVGGRLIFSPNFNEDVVRISHKFGMVPLPGIATPSELYSAIALGVSTVKLYPAEMVPPSVVKCLRSIVPPSIKLLPQGGIEPDDMAEYFAAGANGFGIESALFAPGRPPGEVADRAAAFRAALSDLSRG